MKTRRDEEGTETHVYSVSGSETKRRKLNEGEDDSIPRLLDHSEYSVSPDSHCPTIEISNNELFEGVALETINYQAESKIFQVLPTEVLRYCISFLGSTSDRFALQCTCRQFRKWSDSEHMLRSLSLEGFIAESDSPDKAQVRLHPFALARNIDALYMQVLSDIFGYIFKRKFLTSQILFELRTQARDDSRILLPRRNGRCNSPSCSKGPRAFAVYIHTRYHAT